MKNQPLFTFVFLISLLALNACGMNTPQAAASPAPASSLPSLLPVEHVAVQVGVDSPIPVDVVVSGTWPSLCAQLAQIHQRVENFRIEITLLTTPPDPNCPPDPIAGSPARRCARHQRRIRHGPGRREYLEVWTTSGDR